jgi:hypothetical protein
MFVTGCWGSMPWIAAVAAWLIDVGGTVLIDGRHRWLGELVGFHVADDADDGLQHAFLFERQRDAAADRILIAPEHLRGAAADEHDVRVRVRDVASAQQRHVQRLQVTGHDFSNADRRLITRQQLGRPFVDNRLNRPAGERQVVNRSSGLHAGDRTYPRERGVEEPADL